MGLEKIWYSRHGILNYGFDDSEVRKSVESYYFV